MALPAAPPQVLNAAAATETRVCILGKPTIYFHQKPPGHPCSVRLRGDLSVSHGLRKVVGVRPLEDRRVEVADAAAFTRVDVCTQLILDLLAEAQASSVYETYDLAAKNWVDSSIHTSSPRDIAEAIVARYLEFVDDDDETPAGLEVDIHLPELRVTLIYTCPVCWLDSDTAGEGLVTLPCSHVFHVRCVAPWFHRAPTCPTCRLEMEDPFSYVRSATRDREEVVMDIGAEDDDVLVEGESEDDESEDGQVFDDEPDEEEPLMNIGAEDDVLLEDEFEDDLVFHEESEDEELLFDEEYEDEPLMNIEAEDGVLFEHEFEDDPEMFCESEDEPFGDIMM